MSAEEVDATLPCEGEDCPAEEPIVCEEGDENCLTEGELVDEVAEGIAGQVLLEIIKVEHAPGARVSHADEADSGGSQPSRRHDAVV